ncbi:hypothetical protein [Albidovulum sp.]
MSHSPPSRPPGNEVQLAALARDVAGELALLHGMALALQETLSECRVLPAQRPVLLARLQAIDRISQGLADLQRLMEDLPACLPDDLAVLQDRILKRVQLRQLADRLAGSGSAGSGAPADAARPTAPGEVLLF